MVKVLRTYKKSGLVQGFGVNDLEFAVTFNGKIDPIYDTWKKMLSRAFSEAWHKRYPSYIGVGVSEEWVSAKSFYKWAENKYSKGKQLDKDIIGDGTLYSPESCCFVSKKLNQFLIGQNITHDYPMGVYKEEGRAKFKVMISAGVQGKSEQLGSFENMHEGHLVYCKRKLELADSLIRQEQVEDYIATALIAKLQKKVDEAEILYQQSLI